MFRYPGLIVFLTLVLLFMAYAVTTLILHPS